MMSVQEPPQTPPRAAGAQVKSPVPAPAAGSGLINLGTPRKPDEDRPEAPSICLHVKLDMAPSEESPNAVIDFMRQSEEKYGFETLHPNLRTSIDLLNDADDNDMDEDDDDIDLMADGAATGTTTPKQPQPQAPEKTKNRGRVEGKYDLNDPFIDDSELVWEEQAASTKDGFFVYSGPLIKEGQQPQIERADGTIKRAKGDSTQQAGGKQKGGARAKRKDAGTSAAGTAAKKPRTTKATAATGEKKPRAKGVPGEKKEKTEKKKPIKPKEKDPKDDKVKTEAPDQKLLPRIEALIAPKPLGAAAAATTVPATSSPADRALQPSPMRPSPAAAAGPTGPSGVSILLPHDAPPPSPQPPAQTSQQKASIANLLS